MSRKDECKISQKDATKVITEYIKSVGTLEGLNSSDVRRYLETVIECKLSSETWKQILRGPLSDAVTAFRKAQKKKPSPRSRSPSPKPKKSKSRPKSRSPSPRSRSPSPKPKKKSSRPKSRSPSPKPRTSSPPPERKTEIPSTRSGTGVSGELSSLSKSDMKDLINLCRKGTKKAIIDKLKEHNISKLQGKSISGFNKDPLIQVILGAAGATATPLPSTPRAVGEIDLENCEANLHIDLEKYIEQKQQQEGWPKLPKHKKLGKKAICEYIKEHLRGAKPSQKALSPEDAFDPANEELCMTKDKLSSKTMTWLEAYIKKRGWPAPSNRDKKLKANLCSYIAKLAKEEAEKARSAPVSVKPAIVPKIPAAPMPPCGGEWKTVQEFDEYFSCLPNQVCDIEKERCITVTDAERRAAKEAGMNMIEIPLSGGGVVPVFGAPENLESLRKRVAAKVPIIIPPEAEEIIHPEAEEKEMTLKNVFGNNLDIVLSPLNDTQTKKQRYSLLEMFAKKFIPPIYFTSFVKYTDHMNNESRQGFLEKILRMYGAERDIYLDSIFSDDLEDAVEISEGQEEEKLDHSDLYNWKTNPRSEFIIYSGFAIKLRELAYRKIKLNPFYIKYSNVNYKAKLNEGISKNAIRRQVYTGFFKKLSAMSDANKFINDLFDPNFSLSLEAPSPEAKTQAPIQKKPLLPKGFNVKPLPKPSTCGTRTTGTEEEMLADIRCTDSGKICDLTAHQCVNLAAIGPDLVKVTIKGRDIVGTKDDISKLQKRLGITIGESLPLKSVQITGGAISGPSEVVGPLMVKKKSKVGGHITLFESEEEKAEARRKRAALEKALKGGGEEKETVEIERQAAERRDEAKAAEYARREEEEKKQRRRAVAETGEAEWALAKEAEFTKLEKLREQDVRKQEEEEKKMKKRRREEPAAPIPVVVQEREPTEVSLLRNRLSDIFNVSQVSPVRLVSAAESLDAKISLCTGITA